MAAFLDAGITSLIGALGPGYEKQRSRPVHPAYRKAADALRKKEAASFQVFRVIDQAQHEIWWRGSINVRVDQALQEVSDWTEDVKANTETLEEAWDSLRKAEDAVRDADDNVAACRDAYDSAKDSGSAAEETTALTGLEAARVTVRRREDVEDALRTAQKEAEECLDESRKELSQAQRRLKALRAEESQGPGRAGYSAETIRHCAHYMQSADEIWNLLPDFTRKMVTAEIIVRPVWSLEEFNQRNPPQEG